MSRWPLLVPGFAADATSSDAAAVAQAYDSFETAHRVLGNLIGETLGYAFTAAWTFVVDSSDIITRLGTVVTPVDLGLEQTVDAYRRDAAA